MVQFFMPHSVVLSLCDIVRISLLFARRVVHLYEEDNEIPTSVSMLEAPSCLRSLLWYSTAAFFCSCVKPGPRSVCTRCSMLPVAVTAGPGLSFSKSTGPSPSPRLWQHKSHRISTRLNAAQHSSNELHCLNCSFAELQRLQNVAKFTHCAEK